MDVAALAALAGNTLVAAAVTDAWEDVRGKVAQLFGRGQLDPSVERRLDATRQQLAASPAGELEQDCAGEAARWEIRFADLLADHPNAEDELRALMEEIRATLPPGAVSAADHSLAAGGDIRIAAADGGVAAGVVHGDVTPGPTRPGPAGR